MIYTSKETELEIVRSIFMVNKGKSEDDIAKIIVNALHIDISEIQELLLKDEKYLARLAEAAAKKYLGKS